MLKKENTGSFFAALALKLALATDLTVGFVVTLTLGATVALGLGLPPKREPRAARGSVFAAAAGFTSFLPGA